MDGCDFNITMVRVIKTLPYQLRAPFLYRNGLADGIWYTISEVAHYLHLAEDECKQRLRLAADTICERLGASLQDYICGLPAVDKTAPSSLRFFTDSTDAPRNLGDVVGEMKNAAESVGATMTMLGRSALSDAIVAAIHGGTSSHVSHVLVQIGPQQVDFVDRVIATVFQQREPMGSHHGGRHLGIFGLCISTNAADQELVYLDVDLSNEPSVDTWLSTYGVSRTCEPSEPFLLEPLG